MCEYIVVNPVEDTQPAIKGEQNKRGIFTLKEMADFLDCIDITKRYGQRDRALFELMYSSALRIGETAHLDLDDIDLQNRTLFIHQGKGDKDSYVPFSETALLFLQKYLTGERKKLLSGLGRDYRQALFLSVNGRITKTIIQKRFDIALEHAHIPKKNRSPHSIRHSTATHLLEAGADVRFVSELLRHENIQTTVRYTHLPLEYLKRAYKSAHPRENALYEEVTEQYEHELENLTKELLQLKWGSGMHEK
jgi:site-specific recombinase XerD